MPESKEAIAFNSRARKRPRELAVDILWKVDQKRSFADRLLDAALRENDLEQRDRAFLTELVYGTLRWRGRIDWVAERFLTEPLARMDPHLRNVLRLTLYQILFLTKVPEYAAVHEGVNLAKRHGAPKGGALINAILRRVLREKEQISLPPAGRDSVHDLAVIWSHPQWLVRLWLDYFPAQDIPSLLEANNQESFVTLRVNSLRGDRQSLLEKLHERGIQAASSPWSAQGIELRSAAAVDQLPGFHEGLFQVQGEASQIVGYLLDPQPHERVLDACAAPGGKATHAAELMQDEGEVVVIDTSARGLEKVRENVQRLGLSSVKILRHDVTERLPKACAGLYERILVDAPCSGLGTLRSHPEAKWQRSLGDVRRLAELQRKILDRVVAYLKPGGIMVYATCTLTPDENEGVVARFLENNKAMLLEDASLILPENVKSMTRDKYFLALPHKHDTDGFFAARMRKVANAR